MVLNFYCSRKNVIKLTSKKYLRNKTSNKYWKTSTRHRATEYTMCLYFFIFGHVITSPKIENTLTLGLVWLFT